jgi:predicted HicB family RNase H-like nuclease
MGTILVRNFPGELHRQAKAQAALEGMTLQDFIVKIVEEYLKAINKKGGK